MLEKHEEMAETTQIVFGVLTAGFAALVFLPGLLRRELRLPITRTLLALFLVAYLGGMGVLANTAHDGGRLVHELGIHSASPTDSSGATVSTAVSHPEHE